MEEKLGGFLKEYEIVKEAYTFFDHVKEDFSIAKEYLVPYVFDAEIRATLLENHPYRRIGDIALECHLLYLVALPHLFIVIDEFAEVIAQCSEFKEMIISLSRVGRSLGIHLILATQSPSQSVDSQIWSNSNCKICLKVLNDDESNAVLKVKDAAYIQTRGRGRKQTLLF